LLVKRALFLLNATLAITVLDLIPQLYLPSLVNMLPKYRYIKHSTFSSCFWSRIRKEKIWTSPTEEGKGKREALA
jgi:hypothetical protein